MIRIAEPDLSGNEALYLQDCIRSGFVSSVGPFVDRFETMVAAATESAQAAATASGTCGLHLALHTLGVGRDDVVILPSFTFIGSANAISHCGAEPWLVDIDPETWTLDVGLTRRLLENETTPGADGSRARRADGRRVAAIMPVYVFGHPADMGPLCALAAEFGLPVVADAAAAIGALYRNERSEWVGLGRMGATLSALSFNGNKTLTTGGGGAVFGLDEGLVARARHMSKTARVGRDYHHDEIGFNYRLTNLQAAVGCAQLERVETLVAAKRRIDARYRAAFQDCPTLGAFPAAPWARSGCWFSGAVLQSAERFETTARTLEAAGIDVRPFWKPIHLQPPYRAALRGPCPISEDLWRRVLVLPCSVGLTPDDQDKVIHKVLEPARI